MKKPQQSLNAASQRSKIDHTDDILPSHPLPFVNQARDKGARSLLTSLPLREQGLLALNKQEFRDSLRMGHNLPLEDLPISCTRGSAFQSIMLCTLVKKRRFDSYLKNTTVSNTYWLIYSVKSATKLKQSHIWFHLTMSTRSPIPLPHGQQSKYANPLWYKRTLNSVHYVNLKPAKEKLETELLFLKDVNIRDWNVLSV